MNDQIGNRYLSLEVIDFGKFGKKYNRYKCRCDCGNIVFSDKKGLEQRVNYWCKNCKEDNLSKTNKKRTKRQEQEKEKKQNLENKLLKNKFLNWGNIIRIEMEKS